MVGEGGGEILRIWPQRSPNFIPVELIHGGEIPGYVKSRAAIRYNLLLQ
jgi:hypothetical protein